MTEKIQWFKFNNSYAQLLPQFYCQQAPASVKQPHLIVFNRTLAQALGLDVNAATEAELAAVFAGNHLPAGAEPIALAYAGHQYGHFVPQLGDGRALLLGEVVDKGGVRRDIQLKGSGPTPFSRNGDGRATLGSVIREYLVSEAMHALGVRTTRALAAVATGEMVYRETALPGAILTRVALSHVRVGTFQYFKARDDEAAIQCLADYVIARLYPAAKAAAKPYFALFEAIADAQARLVASWLLLGFIHGVMNTDNMAISGETIDYGPCAFMDAYDPNKAFSAIDRHGRYAFMQQPGIAQWNLARLAETMLTKFDTNSARAIESAQDVLHDFGPRLQHYWQDGMRKKLGLITREPEDLALIETLLALMQRNAADYTLTFRLLCDVAESGTESATLRALFTEQSAWLDWLQRWQQRLNRQAHARYELARSMRAVNPAYIPRNHRLEQVIVAAQRGDFAPMRRLHAVLAQPYAEQPEYIEYARPPLPEECVRQTFCGT